MLHWAPRPITKSTPQGPVHPFPRQRPLKITLAPRFDYRSQTDSIVRNFLTRPNARAERLRLGLGQPAGPRSPLPLIGAAIGQRMMNLCVTVLHQIARLADIALGPSPLSCLPRTQRLSSRVFDPPPCRPMLCPMPNALIQ